MDAVLHIEPIMRQTHAPISVGHHDYLYYGEELNADGESAGNTTSYMQVGCPLESTDLGSPRSHVPLVKTIEYMPDCSRDKGHVYLETLHYFKDRAFLVPFRTKIRTGMGEGLRFNHLPSLNYIREDMTGLSPQICDPRVEIVADILLRDQLFEAKNNPQLKEWITDDLTTSLSKQTINELTFDTESMKSMIHRYINQVHRTPAELTPKHMRDIWSTVSPDTGRLPSQYYATKPILHHIMDTKSLLVPSPVDFRSHGRIELSGLARIDYNPFDFKDVCDLIDRMPLTDFNIDLVLTPDNDVNFYHEHVAFNRFGQFVDDDTGAYQNETIFRHFFDEYTLHSIIEKFFRFHTQLTPEIEDILTNNPVKMKFIKTILDEAIILLYRNDSGVDEAPLCGVYFDIALQSLAPMSIMRQPIGN